MELQKVSIKRIIGPTPSGAAVLVGNEDKTFVVFIGFYEAAALIREINKDVPARPLTHELIQNVFLGFDVEIKQVIISSIIDNTFCATLILRQRVNDNGVSTRSEVRIDARPSDCFVMALKNDVDLFVTKEVFDNVPDVTHMAEDVENSLTGGQVGSAFISGEEIGQLEGQLEIDLRPSEEVEEGSETLFEDFPPDDDEEDDEPWKV